MRQWVRNVQVLRPWKSGHAKLLLRQSVDTNSNARAGISDEEHLKAAARWLSAAQDASKDGGISGRYKLAVGWTSSYPETTGYIVPTLLALADHLNDDSYRERARRAIRFLLSIQLDSGAFPGLEIAENRTEASAFNSAQILHGLTAWHRATGDEETFNAARRAADWLLSIQDADGSWTRHCYSGVANDYSAHLSCWLAEFGQHTGEQRYLDAASRHVDWVLSHINTATGWFSLAGFSTEQHNAGEAFTHTIAYTIWGVLYSSQILGSEDGIKAAARAAAAVARRLELQKSLPGILNHEWKPAHLPVCLTGNCQMALIWFRLYEINRDETLLNAALKAIDEVKRAQPLGNPNPGINGGIPGSFPIWGKYITNAIPNWAAKYFIDALLEKKRTLEMLSNHPKGKHRVAADAPRTLPGGVAAGAPAQKVVLLTSIGSRKVPQFLEAWKHLSFKPAAVVVEEGTSVPAGERLKEILRQEGLTGVSDFLGRRLGLKRAPARNSTKPAAPTAGGGGGAVLTYCAARGIPVIKVPSVNSDRAIEAVKAMAPDVLLHAGAGILRARILSLPRLGTLNAHMGLLPWYRGMNVAEWSAFNGDDVGCTAHLIDDGIDTGDILLVRPLKPAAKSIDALRVEVDRAQADLLGEVLRYVLTTGALPPRMKQKREDGRQYFSIHRALKEHLEKMLEQRDLLIESATPLHAAE